ncbi:MAG: Brp/Blh family beta-carotene 15,15'-dioxygenase [Haloferacaceae archaeon]
MSGTTERGGTQSADGRRDDVAALMLTVGSYPAWLTVAAVTVGALVVCALGVTVPPWAGYLPLAASLVVFGLPHGAVDHLASARAADRPVTPAWLGGVGLLYLLLGGVYVACWVVAPVAAAVFFVALTWFHWGQGDLYALDVLGGGYLRGGGVRAATLVVRGGLPMLVPLIRFPDQYRAVVGAWVALFGGAFDATWLASPRLRATVGVAFAGLTLGTLLWGRRRVDGTRAGRAWRRDAAETCLLWAFFLLVPPLVAVGVYFCVWHSLRHVVRLVGVDDGARATLGRRGAVAALARTGREAVPLTALSLLSLLGFGAAVGVRTGASELAALYLVFISVVTLPHVAVVTWMDRAERAETVKG